MKTIFSRLVILLSLIFIAFPLISYAGAGTSFDKIVFFGDSLSDNGNLYRADYGFMPKSPPYFKGKFTNGDVWSEYAEKYFYNKNYIGSANFAVGGETAILHNPLKGFLPFNLSASVDSYWARTLFRDRSHTLFVIWIGANDYLNGANNTEQLTTEVTEHIRDIIQELIREGGMNFLVINLPDLSRTPLATNLNMINVLADLSNKHNAKLATVVSQMIEQNKAVNIHLFDLNALFVDMLNNTQTYNIKHGINITNIKGSCWQGGYTLHAANQNQSVTEEKIYQELLEQKRLKYKANGGVLATDNQAATIVPKGMDDRQLAHYLFISPALREAYSVTEKAEGGVKPCQNPDNYVFWDQIHPTAIVHKVLSEYLIKYMEANFQSKN